MRTAIDASGRVLIPKKVRDQAAFPAGVELEVRYADGKIVLEPAPTQIRIERRGRFNVAVPISRVEPMEPSVVDETIDRIRNERGE